ncbi:hypothetical protein HYU13_01655, partial [Candidatus Woesearchaeota archaeon]|nr:hypothetical protein [Candidatus Woesearchaeota archaeon]
MGEEPTRDSEIREGEINSEDEQDDFKLDFSKIKSFFGKLRSDEGSEGSKSSKANKDREDSEGSEGNEHESSSTAGSRDNGKGDNGNGDNGNGDNGSRDNDNNDEDNDDSPFALDPKTVSSIFALLKKSWPLLLLIIPLFITAYVRAQTINLTIADDWGKGNVYEYYQRQFTEQAKKQYPNLPEANLKKIIDGEFKKFLKENGGQLDEQSKQNAAQLRNFFQYESGTTKYPYMGDIDSYYWLRQARNLLEKDSICDLAEGDLCYDTYTMAPAKLRLYPNLHPYLIFYLYKIVRPLKPDFTLMQAELYVPTILSLIVAIFIFMMMLKPFGPLASLTASTLISVNPIFLTRSLGSDTDIYNVLFPVLIVFFLFAAFIAKTNKKRIGFMAGAGLLMGAYSFAWVGWWYLFDFAVIALIANYTVHVARDVRKKKKVHLASLVTEEQTKKFAALIIPLILASFLSVGIISGFSSLKNIYTEPLAFTKAKVAANPNIWPNVKTTVAEFNEASIPNVIDQMGGKWFFFFSLIGFIVLIYRNFKNVLRHIAIFLLSILILYYLVTPGSGRLAPITYLSIFAIPFLIGAYFAFISEEEEDIAMPVFFFLWIASSVYAATKGVRFSLLLVPPMAIGIGVTFGFLQTVLPKMLARKIPFPRWAFALVLFLFLSYPLVQPVKAGVSIGKGYLPTVNDQWWGILAQIKEQSKPDAIINSWWDFGHWFKYIADRRVTLDGSSQNNPPLHWLGKTLLTSNDTVARGVLRMVDCGSNMAFTELNKKKNDTPKAVEVLNRMIVAERDAAEQMLLADGFSKEEAEKVLGFSHCEPPEDFFITSEDMIGKGAVWAHFGGWDFQRAWLQKAFSESSSKEEFIAVAKKEFNFSEQEFSRYYQELKGLASDKDINSWISPWPSYMSGPSRCRNESASVTCKLQGIDVEVNLSTMDASVKTPQGAKRLNVLSYTTPDGISTITYAKDTIGAGMVLMITKDGYYSLFMAPELVNSLFTRLYFLDGHGTRFFDLFSDTSGMSGFKIKVWKVNW